MPHKNLTMSNNLKHIKDILISCGNTIIIRYSSFSCLQLDSDDCTVVKEKHQHNLWIDIDNDSIYVSYLDCGKISKGILRGFECKPICTYDVANLLLGITESTPL